MVGLPLLAVPSMGGRAQGFPVAVEPIRELTHFGLKSRSNIQKLGHMNVQAIVHMKGHMLVLSRVHIKAHMTHECTYDCININVHLNVSMNGQMPTGG